MLEQCWYFKFNRYLEPLTLYHRDVNFGIKSEVKSSAVRNLIESYQE